MACSSGERCSHLSGVKVLCQYMTDCWKRCACMLSIGKSIAQGDKVLAIHYGGVINNDDRHTDWDKFTRQDTVKEFYCVVCNIICSIRS